MRTSQQERVAELVNRLGEAIVLLARTHSEDLPLIALYRNPQDLWQEESRVGGVGMATMACTAAKRDSPRRGSWQGQ